MLLKQNEIDNPEFAVYKYRRLIEGEVQRYGQAHPSTVNLFGQAIALLLPKSNDFQYTNGFNLHEVSTHSP